MKFLLQLLSFGILVLLCNSNANNCDSPCPKIPKHYQELGCTPVTSANKCCPER